MKQIIMILTLCAGIHQSASAQSFTQRIQQSTAGKGTVTIHQSAEIDQLVNGAQLSASRPLVPATPTPPATPASPTTSPSTETTDSPVDNSKKMMRGGYKINGFRVQAFAGGNSRKDRQQAEHVGNQIKASFPDEPVYVHFYSPRWICRVGNYRTYEEAHQMLLSLRKIGFTEATIVKGKITVQD